MKEDQFNSYKRQYVPFLDDNKTVIVNETEFDNMISLFFRLGGNGETRQIDLPNHIIYDNRDSLSNYSKRINDILETDKDFENPIQNHESFLDFVDITKILSKSIFNENEDFFESLISFSKKPSKLEYNSRKFSTPLEFINVKQNSTDIEILADYFIINRKSSSNKANNVDNRIVISDLNLSYIANKNLDSVEKEVDFFSDLHENESYPFIFTNHEEINHRTDFPKKLCTNSNNFVHLSCHLELIEDMKESRLVFTNFGFPLRKFDEDENKDIWKDKILFANTCNSSHSNTKYDRNLIEHFLGTGICSLICVGLEIDDDFAGGFTKRFYSNIMNSKPNETLQHVLYKTSNYYWKEQRNPLGFFYTCVGPIIYLNCN